MPAFPPSSPNRVTLAYDWAPALWADSRELRALWPCQVTGRWVSSGTEYLVGHWRPYRTLLSLKGETAGIVLWDGSTYKKGGTVIGSGTSPGKVMWIWGAGAAGVYIETQETIHKISHGAVTNTFQVGEAVTQAVSGAAGYLIRDDGSILYILETTGTFDATNVITGGTSGAFTTASAHASASGRVLQRSTNGTANFYPVRELRGGAVGAANFCDCGSITGVGQVLLYLSYNNDSEKPEILYNLPGTNDTWTQLIESNAIGSDATAAIRHLHGAKWLPGVGAGDGRLIVMTGDNGNQPSLLYCDDVADLVANPSTWKTRWGLDQLGANRDAWLSGGGAAYCAQPYLAADDVAAQAVRVVDLVPDAASDATACYWFPDSNTAADCRLHRLDLATMEWRKVGRTEIPGVGGSAVLTDRGIMLLSTWSQAATGAYIGNSDDTVRVYQVLPDGSEAVAVAEFERQDTATLTLNATLTLVSALGAVWAGPTPGSIAPWVEDHSLERPYMAARVGTLQTASGVWRDPIRMGIAPVLQGINILENGRAAINDFSYWVLKNATVAQETSTVDSVRGEVAAYRITSAASNSTAYIEYPVPTRMVQALRGGFITFSARVLWPSTLASTQVPFPAIRIDAVTHSCQIFSTDFSDTWKTICFSVFVPQDCDELAVRLYGKSSGTDTDPVYYSDISLASGGLPCPPRAIGRVALDQYLSPPMDYRDFSGLLDPAPATTGSELLTNGGMETDTTPADGVPDNWTADHAATLSQENDPRTGSAGAKSLGATGASDTRVAYQAVTLTPNTWYLFDGWARVVDAVSATIAACGGVSTAVTGTSWTRVQAAGFATVASNTISCYLGDNKGGRFDDLSLKELTLSTCLSLYAFSAPLQRLRVQATHGGAPCGIAWGWNSPTSPTNGVVAYYDTYYQRPVGVLLSSGAWSTILSASAITDYVAGAYVEIRQSGGTLQLWYNGRLCDTAQVSLTGLYFGWFSTSAGNTLADKSYMLG